MTRPNWLCLVGLLIALQPVPTPAQYVVIDLGSAAHGAAANAGADGTQVGWKHSETQLHATLWNGSSASAVDLHPPGYAASTAYALYGDTQGGYGELVVTHEGARYFVHHALLWSGSAATAVDLHPTPFKNSHVFGMDQDRQVGATSGTFDGGAAYRAAIWQGSTESFQDIHPAGYAHSAARAVSGEQVVGWGSRSDETGARPLLWQDGRVLDLRPDGFGYTEASGVSMGRQVGWGRGNPTGWQYHALAWQGSAGSYVDLHPAGYQETYAAAIHGTRIVGYGRTNEDETHALLWTINGDGEGSSFTPLDLHAFLPPEFVESSANDVDASGHVVGGARHVTTGQWHAVVWVPEPGCVVGGIVVAAAATHRRHRRT